MNVCKRLPALGLLLCSGVAFAGESVEAILADHKRPGRDLAAAHAAGDVELQVVKGPESCVAAHPAARIA
jgi:hypothetical protein